MQENPPTSTNDPFTEGSDPLSPNLPAVTSAAGSAPVSASTTRVDDVASLRLALEEYRIGLEESHSSSETLDNKVNFLIAAASVALTLVPGMTAGFEAADNPVFIQVAPMVVVFLLLASIINSLVAMRPREYRSTLNPTWEVVEQYFQRKTEREALRNLLVSIVEEININRNHNLQKSRGYYISAWMFGIGVGALVLTTMLQTYLG